MRIRFLVAISSSEDWSFAPGEETERFSDEQAQSFISGGIAEEVATVQINAPKAKPAKK